MLFDSLTDHEKHLISQMASDSQTGRHLLRDEDGWKELGINKREYFALSEQIGRFARDFSFITHDGTTRTEREMLLYFKCCLDKEFYDMLSNKD
jgi:hypothetical protein